jgi:hypothetical protein
MDLENKKSGMAVIKRFSSSLKFCQNSTFDALVTSHTIQLNYGNTPVAL